MKQPRLHFIGICGKAMGPIAAALHRQGWHVTGSDEDSYPPMGDYLARNNLTIRPPARDAAFLGQVQLFVVGKRVTEDNPELAWVLENGAPYRSFPAFLEEFFLVNSRNAVVAGGVGKTTTTSILAWILEHAGLRPDYLVGGMSGNLEHPARFAGSGVAVLEGDEYASCFDDPRPKFRHYAASIGIVTNLLQDHPDLFSGADAMRAVFERWVETIPPEGLLILPDDDPEARRLTDAARCRIMTVGFSADASSRVEITDLPPEGSRFSLGAHPYFLPLCGRMNIRNAAAGILAARELGVEPKVCAEALRSLRGVANRQETREIGGCAVVLDKACHPASLSELFQAVRQKFPGRRLVSFIQPRATGGREWIYQRDLPKTLAAADLVLLAKPYEHKPRPGQSWPGGPFSLEQLLTQLGERQTPVHVLDSATQPDQAFQNHLKTGDVLVISLPEQASRARDAVITALRHSPPGGTTAQPGDSTGSATRS
jgi:UDP-N-acetylmuramate: L-alanyl-gamma-D-glutamyl-meso-diaminopimelate ligase